MSDSRAYEEITVATDGVTVTKRFGADEFPVPAIAFNVSSKRTESVRLRLVDSVPDDVAAEDLGFHPEYGSEFWEVTDDRIIFEKELEPEADYTTVYGIRATGTDDVEKFLTEPGIESVDPQSDGDENEGDPVGDDGNAAGDVTPDDADSDPAAEHDDDANIETLELKDPNSDDVGPAVDGEAAEGDVEIDTDVDVEAGNVIAAMAAEIRENDVSADDVRLLQRALDAVSEEGSQVGGVDSARLKRIQGDIADLRAYTDALEEFLEENGTGEEMIAEFNDRLDSFDAQLDTFESDLAQFEDDVWSAKSAARDASDGLDDIGGEVESLEGQINDVEGTIDTIEGDMASLEAEIEDVREELDEGELDERLSELEEQVTDLREWRDQLSSVIG